MRLRRPVLTSLCLAMLSASAAHALDLSEAFAKAQQNDPDWRAARNTYLADSREDAVGLGGLLPSVAANGSVSKTEFDPDSPTPTNPAYDADTTQWAVKATQPLFRADAWFDYQRARAVASQAEASFRSQEQALALRVSQAYFSVLSAQETLAYAESEEAAFGRQLDQAQQRFDVGLIAITDVLEARASFDSSRANRIAAEAALQAAKENLAVIIGENPGKLAPLKPDTPMLKPTPADPEAWAKLAREQNPDLIAARRNQETALAVSRQVKSGHLPTVDLFASYSSMDRDAGSNIFGSAQNGTTTAVGLEASWSIFAGGRTYNTSRQASYRAAAAQDIATGTEKQVVNSARTAFNNVSADSYRVEARKQAVASTEASLDATQAGYEVGTRNIVDVLLAQRNSFAAKRDYAAARYDYVINSLRLKAASGQLSEVDIKELNTWLDPNASVVSAPEKPAEPVEAPAALPRTKKR
ncbi:MAG: secretion protein [Moraxellaceae bacterium]|jgi:outer membrane protein|nr:secretion protein [Moraxellaceae bacterium]MDF3030486.1 secretion protein [Moraxellaceae bacterium]